MYFVLPLWLAAGFADYLCHRASHIEATSGPKESALHLLQFAEMAIPTLAAPMPLRAPVRQIGRAHV